MKPKQSFLFLVVFTAVTIGHILLQYFGSLPYSYFLKPLIIPALAGWLYSENKNSRNAKVAFIYLALFFSWLGDVLLMFEAKNSLFFIFGLASFLLAHLLYITWFVSVLKNHRARLRILPICISIFISASMVAFLFPNLGGMLIPVVCYALAIGTMLAVALHTLYLPIANAGKWLALGAVLFVVSDATLAINKFYAAFAVAGIIIMITYAAAQFCIVRGVVDYGRKVV